MKEPNYSKSINLKIPGQLHKQLKTEAALRCQTMRELIISRLQFRSQSALQSRMDIF